MDFFFMQELHSSIKNENIWIDDFNGWVFFSHGGCNSCSLLIAYLGRIFVINKQKTDESGKIFILDVMLDTDQYILINLYNANTKTEQLKILREVQSLLKIFGINQNK